jgi:hypothetical protein
MIAYFSIFEMCNVDQYAHANQGARDVFVKIITNFFVSALLPRSPLGKQYESEYISL